MVLSSPVAALCLRCLDSGIWKGKQWGWPGIEKKEGRTVAASEHGERIGRVEDRVEKLTEDVNQRKRAYEHLATRDDVSSAALRIVLWLVGVGVTLAAIQVSVLFQLLTRLPG